MNSQIKNPSFYITTLGCKVNQYESERMREKLLVRGLSEVGRDNPADFYIINSCTVTHKADRDTRRLVRHYNNINPKAKVVVCGCYAELEEDRGVLSGLPGVSLLLRNGEKEKAGDMILRHCEPRIFRGEAISKTNVIPAKAGIQILDSRFHGNDKVF